MQHTVSDADDDIRLDRWFKRHVPGLPHALLEKNLRKGLIRIDGKKAKSSDRIRAGQMLECPEINAGDQPKKRREATPEEASEIKKWVLYKDKNLIILNKPFGLPVQGGNKIVRSLDDMLGGLIEKEGDERPRLVHRLDRDTSGCLVLARNSKTATQMMHIFSGRRVEKIYLALVNNLPEPLSGTIDLPLLKKENPLASGKPSGPQGRDYEIMQVDEEGQKAISEYRVVDMLARRFALVELKPLTGRTHQLRVHMQAIGCPIFGDHKYGGGSSDVQSLGVANQLHLHARRIIIPMGGRTIDITAPLPEHMKNTFDTLGIEMPKK